MKLKFKTSSIFTKYLISYLLILILPILILGFTFTTTITHLLKDELIAKDSSSIQLSTFNLSKEFATLERIAGQINFQDDIPTFTLNRSPSLGIDVIDHLKKYSVSNNFLSDIYIHFYEDDYVYSSTSSAPFNSFLSEYTLEDLSPNAFRQKLYDITQPTFINNISAHDKKYIAYATPFIDYTTNSQSGVIIFLSNMDSINQTLGNTNTSHFTYLIDSNNTDAFFKSINTLSISEPLKESLSEVLNDLNNSPITKRTTDHYVLHAFSEKDLNLSYLTLSSNREVFSTLSRFEAILLSALLFTLIISSILIYILSRINYKPIGQLKDFSSTFSPKLSDSSEKNEFELVKNILLTLNDYNQNLQYELEKNIPIRQNFMLNQLVNGTIGDLEQFIKECAAIHIILSSAYYGIVSIKSNEPITHLDTTLSDLSDIQMDYSYLVQHLSPDIYVFLVGSSNTLSRSQCTSSSYVVSLSHFSEQLKDIPYCYIESRDNLELYLRNKPSVNDLLHSSTIYALSLTLKDYVAHIHTCLSANDLISLEHTLSNLTEYLDRTHLPYEIIRNVYFEVLIIFNEYFETNKNYLTYSSIELATLYEIDSVKGLKEVFLEIIHELLELLALNQHKSEPSLSIESIKSCIDTTYMEYSFSLQLIADKFNVSLSYLSQYFKDRMEITILDYVTDLKITKAKHLLETTDLTLKYIVEQVGYLNVSSFIRRFKQVTGLTPGEYKKSYQNSNSLN